jgi:hypothetical protein
VTVCRHVPEVDDTVGGKPAGARRECHPDVDRRVCPQPEVRLVGHPGRVAVSRCDLPLADEGFGVAQAAGLVDADLGSDATAQCATERERESVTRFSLVAQQELAVHVGEEEIVEYV